MEIVVLSGKGGTGKTTIATALSELFLDVMKVDCDVDAPNLYMMYEGTDIFKAEFKGSKVAVLNKEKCINCGKCIEVCKYDAIKNYEINNYKCEGCGACKLVCEQGALELIDIKVADMFVTQNQKGMISRAQMEIGSDGSGKLITAIRKKAKEYKKKESITIIDGSPGVGCPVISSMTNTNLSVIVTEPTKSGLEDLKRILELCERFKLNKLVCINKYDINEEISKEIEKYCGNKQIEIAGKIPFDNTVMKSINELKPITHYENSMSAKSIKEMFKNIELKIEEEL